MFFLVMPLDETEWSLEPAVLAARMRERWPDVELSWVGNPKPGSEIDFEIPLGRFVLSGWIPRDGRSLHLDSAEPEQMAEVAVWFRDQVPGHHPLLFLDEGNSGCVRIEGWMTADQLASAYLASEGWSTEPGYMVSPPEHSDWAHLPRAFVAQMRERWPEAVVTVHEHGGPLQASVEFAVRAGGGDVVGWFGGVGRILFMEAAERERAALVALWYREQVPSEQPLDFLGAGPGGGRTPLERGMTVEQLLAACRASVA